MFYLTDFVKLRVLFLAMWWDWRLLINSSHFPRMIMAPYLPSPLFHLPSSPICPPFLHSSLTSDPLLPFCLLPFLHSSLTSDPLLPFCLLPFLHSSLPSLFLLHFSPSPLFFSPPSLHFPFFFSFSFLPYKSQPHPKMLPVIWEFNAS